MHPAASRAKDKKHTSVVTTGSPVSPGLPCAMVLTVSFALSPVTGLVCHRRLRKLPSADLTPASGRQDHTTSPSADQRQSSLTLSASTASRTQRRDDRATPLLWGTGHSRCAADLGLRSTAPIAADWHDGQINVLGSSSSMEKLSKAKCRFADFHSGFLTPARSVTSVT
jgi:hypothetical protein